MDSLFEMCPYDATNESLDAFVAGLDLQSSDTVVAVGGSGDHCFAALEFANKVIVVDNNSKQLDLIDRRREALRQGNLDSFLWDSGVTVDAWPRKEYFSVPDRFERIRSNFGNLVVRPPMGLLSFFRGNHELVDTVFLSNALGYGRDNSDPAPEDQELLDFLGNSLRIGARIYITNADEVMGPGKRYVQPNSFVVDSKRTGLVRALERESPLFESYHWQPTVFKIKK